MADLQEGDFLILKHRSRGRHGVELVALGGAQVLLVVLQGPRMGSAVVRSLCQLLLPALPLISMQSKHAITYWICRRLEGKIQACVVLAAYSGS